MASTRGIRVRFDPFGDIYLSSRQPVCSSNAQLAPMMNVGNVCIEPTSYSLDIRRVRPQDTHSDGVWAPGTPIKCYHRQ